MDVGDDLILGGDKDDDMFGFMELEELDGSLAGEIFGAEAFARGEGAKASGGELVKSDKKGNKDEKGGKRGKGPVRVGGEPSPDVLAARVAELERENARLRRMSGSLDEDDGNGCGAHAGKNARTSAAEVQVAKNERKKNEKKKKKKAGKDRGKEQEQKQEEEMPAARERVDVSAWREYHLEEEVLEAIAELGFVAPTQIQAECLPSAVRDRMDIIGAAQTGSGKTLAFGAANFVRIVQRKKGPGCKKGWWVSGSLPAPRTDHGADEGAVHAGVQGTGSDCKARECAGGAHRGRHQSPEARAADLEASTRNCGGDSRAILGARGRRARAFE